MATKTPSEVIEAVHAIGASKLALSSRFSFRFLLLAILAGAYIALGGVLSVIIGFGFPEFTAGNPGLQKLLSGCVFPVGLILVVVLGAELFTGNNALLMPQLMSRRCGWGSVLVNWGAVWIGNFIGALLLLYLLVTLTGIVAVEPYRSAVVKMAEAKVSMDWLTVFLKGIGANWCVCLAIWLALSAKSSGAKMFGCWMPVMAFVALGYEHAIANMFFIPCGMLEGADVTVGRMIWCNLIPATAGNIIGGALLVGCVHAYLWSKK